MKDFIKLLRSCAKTKSRIRFLKACIRYNLEPIHLMFIERKVRLFEKVSINLLDRINNNYTTKLLKLELKDTYQHLHITQKSIF